MRVLVVFAAAWGRTAGGINAFNMEMATSLGVVLGNEGRVVCVVPTLGTPTATSANCTRESAVEVLRVPVPAIDSAAVPIILQALQSLGLARIDCWIGHDVLTGQVANAARDQSGDGTSVVVMHMSYRAYQGYKHGSSTSADTKHERQSSILRSADRVCAVGPLLRDRAREVVSDVIMLVPGLSEIPVDNKRVDRVSAISFGRYEAENDRIKQIKLAVASFAKACLLARNPGGLGLLRDNSPSITMLGVAEEDAEHELSRVAEQYAGRVLTVHALPYEPDKQRLFARIAESNLSLVLSWHEGFGLSAWESIAGGVPLVLSKQSGVYKLLETFGLHKLISAVDIDGSLGQPADTLNADAPFSPRDLDTCSEAILETCGNLSASIRSAATLRTDLTTLGITWRKMAEDLLDELGLAEQPCRRDDVLPAKEEARMLGTEDNGKRLTAGFEKFLEESDLLLEHPRLGRLRLPDYYVVPDLQEFAKPGTAGRISIISGEAVVNRPLELEQVLLVGDTQSGKTSLSKFLFRRYFDAGYFPVYLSDLRKPTLGTELARLVAKAFAKQYAHPSPQEFAFIDFEKKVLIVDDFHLLGGKQSLRRRCQEELRRLAKHAIFFAHDISLSVEDVIGFEDDSSRRYMILPLGHMRRAELIDKWCADDDDIDERKLAQRVTDMTRLVDTIVGKNFVPALPPYVLAVIQAHSAGTAVDTTAGTHGYFYELLIKGSLARGATGDQLDVTIEYLANLASRMLEHGCRVLSMAQVAQAHADFEERTDLSIDLHGTIAGLKRRSIFVQHGDELEFKYPYLYYYFAAVHLRDTLDEPGTRGRIASLATTLHVEEPANILLFIAHLTRNDFVINTILTASRAAFVDATPAALLPDECAVDDFNSLVRSTEKFLDVDPEEARRLEYEAMDESQRELELQSETQAVKEPASEMVRVGQALAAIQLLGQVVKNFPGKLDASKKKEIVGECYALGRRFLGWYFQFVSSNNQGIIAEVARVVRDVHPRFPVRKLVTRAQEILGEVVAISAIGIVRRISTAVGSRHLQLTHAKLYDPKVPIVRLYDFSIRLDHVGDFPVSELKALAKDFDSNILSLVVLRCLVAQHLRLFPVDRATKHLACSVLRMRLEQGTAARSDVKLLPE